MFTEAQRRAAIAGIDRALAALQSPPMTCEESARYRGLIAREYARNAAGRYASPQQSFGSV